MQYNASLLSQYSERSLEARNSWLKLLDEFPPDTPPSNRTFISAYVPQSLAASKSSLELANQLASESLALLLRPHEGGNTIVVNTESRL